MRTQDAGGRTHIRRRHQSEVTREKILFKSVLIKLSVTFACAVTVALPNVPAMYVRTALV